MKRKLSLLALVALMLFSAMPVLAEDGFYVIAGRYTPGTKITSLPYTITAQGYYYLNRNLTYTGGDGITITSDNVTIDLMGFALTGPGNNTNTGIDINGTNIEVRNGTVTGWFSAVYGHSGSNQRTIGVRAVGNTYGIVLVNGLIKDCTASQGSFAEGLVGLTVLRGTISGCTVYNSTSSYQSSRGLYIGKSGTVSDNVVLDWAAIGIEGYALSAEVGPTTISNNAVINCGTGISSKGGGSIIGNAVKANAGQTGIAPATETTPSATPTLLDQNSVNGDGIHYGPGNTATVKGLNGG
jgi:hypothetical protein